MFSLSFHTQSPGMKDQTDILSKEHNGTAIWSKRHIFRIRIFLRHLSTFPSIVTPAESALPSQFLLRSFLPHKTPIFFPSKALPLPLPSLPRNLFLPVQSQTQEGSVLLDFSPPLSVHQNSPLRQVEERIM